MTDMYYPLRRLLTFGILLTTALLSATELHAQQTHRLLLAGHKTVPPVSTGASGAIDVTLNGDSLSVSGTFRRLSGVYAGAGIHVAERDKQGNRLYRLEPELKESNKEGSFSAEENTFVLNETQKQLLAAGEFYISIYTFKHRRGEIRAQIPPMSSSGE